MADQDVVNNGEQVMMVMEDYSVATGINDIFELQKNFVYTPRNAVLWYQCDICKRKSATKQRLDKHMEQKHSSSATMKSEELIISEPFLNSEAYKCIHCPFSCSTNADLMRHSQKHKGTKPYKCPICGQAFSQKGNLKPHMVRHSGELPFKCTFCPRAFNHKTSFQKHIEEHKTPKRYACRFCSSFSASITERREHENKVHSKQETDCIVCGIILNSALGLKLHVSQMHPEYSQATDCAAEKKWVCAFCNKKFSTKAYLSIHYKIHRGEKPFQCGMCEYRAVSKDSIRKHTERSHGQAKTLSCNLCAKKFTYYSHKKSHMLRHYNLKPFSCDLCERSFMLKRHLTDHLRMHKGDRKYRCNKCDVAYILPNSLRKHMDLHLCTPLICHLCKKQFWITGRYNKHMMMHRRELHASEGYIKPFKCKICKKGFKYERHLLKHISGGCSLHSIREIECTECGAILSNKQNLKQHMKTFHNLKEYSCLICAEGFRRISQLDEHINLMHSGKSASYYSAENNEVNRISSKSFLKRDLKSESIRRNNKITITSVEAVTEDWDSDQMLSESCVLVVDANNWAETDCIEDSIKIETSEIFYKCYTCGCECSSYDNLLNHEMLHNFQQESSTVIKSEEYKNLGEVEGNFISLANVKDEDLDAVSNDALEIFADSSGQLHSNEFSHLNHRIVIDDQTTNISRSVENSSNMVAGTCKSTDISAGNVQLKSLTVDDLVNLNDGAMEVSCYECRKCGRAYFSYVECQEHYYSMHFKNSRNKR